MPEDAVTATAVPPPWRGSETLERSPVPCLRKLHVEESESEVIISGTVSSFYFKQLAQEALMPVLGPRRLYNRVEV